jgi:hypothetical protein
MDVVPDGSDEEDLLPDAMANNSDDDVHHIAAEEHVEDIHEQLQDMAGFPVFEKLPLSSLSTTLLILNACRTHRCSSAFILELFRLW